MRRRNKRQPFLLLTPSGKPGGVFLFAVDAHRIHSDSHVMKQSPLVEEQPTMFDIIDAQPLLSEEVLGSYLTIVHPLHHD